MAFLVREVLREGPEGQRYYGWSRGSSPSLTFTCTRACSRWQHLTLCTSSLCLWTEKGHTNCTHDGRGTWTPTSRKKPFPQVLLSDLSTHTHTHPITVELQITPLDSIYSETTPNIKLGGRACVGSNYETEIGHSVTNIISFSFPESASLVSFIPRLKAQPCYSSPCQTALGGHFCFVCDWLCRLQEVHF